MANSLADDLHAIIVDVAATLAHLSQEIVAAKEKPARSADAVAFTPDDITADKSSGTRPFLSRLLDRKITPCVLVLDRTARADGN